MAITQVHLKISYLADINVSMKLMSLLRVSTTIKIQKKTTMAQFFLSLLTTATAGALIKNKLIKPKKTKLVRPISTPEIY